MSDDTHRISIRYKPRSGPRRRVGFDPDETLGDVAYACWRTEEVYSTVKGEWREVGREHITDVSVTADPVMTDIGVATQPAHDNSVSNEELLMTAAERLAHAIELSSDGRPADARAAIRNAVQRLEAVRNARTEEVSAE